MLVLTAVLAVLVALNVGDRLAPPAPVVVEPSTRLLAPDTAPTATVAVDEPVQAHRSAGGDTGEMHGSRPALRALRPSMDERGGDPFNPPSPPPLAAATPRAERSPPVRLMAPSAQPTVQAVPIAVPLLPPAAPRPPGEIVGMIVDDQGPAVFVATSHGVMVGRSGSSIDGQWRIRSIDLRAVDMLHVPSGQSVQVGLTHLNVKP